MSERRTARDTTKTVEVTTAAAISRELPASFFEATGSLAGDEQTGVAPQTAGKVVEVGADIGSAVRRRQMIVRGWMTRK